MRDVQTGTLWNTANGEAIRGELTGRRLAPLTTRRAYWFVWIRFQPETEILDAHETGSPAS